MVKKRSTGGRSKPYMRSISRTNSGSRPRAPRYREVRSPPAPPTVSPPPVPEIRDVTSTPGPMSASPISARSCSTGPPGATWMMTKLRTMIPNRVGIMNSTRRTM